MKTCKNSKRVALFGLCFGTMCLIAGAVLIALKMEQFAHILGVLCGLGGGLLATSLVYFIRTRNPEKLKQLEVEQTDERNHMIRGKAGLVTFVVTTLLLAALEITCFMIGERTAAMLTMCVMFAHLACFLVTAAILNKKL